MAEYKTYELDLIFHALGDPIRRSILRKLSKKERTISEIAESFSVSLAAVSKHIKSLERAKLVHRRREGNFFYLSLNAEALSSADEWMEYYREFWQQNLSSLKDFIERKPHD